MGRVKKGGKGNPFPTLRGVSHLRKGRKILHPRVSVKNPPWVGKGFPTHGVCQELKGILHSRVAKSPPWVGNPFPTLLATLNITVGVKSPPWVGNPFPTLLDTPVNRKSPVNEKSPPWVGNPFPTLLDTHVNRKPP